MIASIIHNAHAEVKAHVQFQSKQSFFLKLDFILRKKKKKTG